MEGIEIMEIAHAIVRLPPFHGGGHRETVRLPRPHGCERPETEISGYAGTVSPKPSNFWKPSSKLTTATPQALAKAARYASHQTLGE